MTIGKLFHPSLALAILSSVTLSAPHAHAQVFTDRAAWLAAVGVAQTEDFESAPVGSILSGTTNLGLVSLTTDRYSEFYDLPRIQDGGEVNGTRELRGYITNPDDPEISGEPGFGPNFMTFSFGSPVTAWGGDFASATSGALLTVETAGTVYQMSDFLSAPGTGFFGIVSSTPFSTITLGKANPLQGEEFSLDNLSFSGASAAAPEPGTLTLLLGTLSPFVVARIQRRR